jgi:hypothetical protein
MNEAQPMPEGEFKPAVTDLTTPQEAEPAPAGPEAAEKSRFEAIREKLSEARWKAVEAISLGGASGGGALLAYATREDLWMADRNLMHNAAIITATGFGMLAVWRGYKSAEAYDQHTDLKNEANQ